MRDLRFAIRALRRAPTFAVVAVLSLAIGIGANVSVFSLVNSLLLRPLPVPHSDQLVRIGRSTRDAQFATFSYVEYQELRSNLATLVDLVGHHPNSATLTVSGEPRTTWLELVSANYFSVLGVRPALGRGFLPEQERAADATPVVVVSHRLWQSRFGADPGVIGRPTKINGHTFTIVGVAPPGFRGTFVGFDIDAWVPATMQAVAVPSVGSMERRDDRFLMVIGRLRRGASADHLRPALAVMAPRLRAAQQDTAQSVRLDVASATGVHPFIARIIRAFLGLLQGIVLLVLLVACVNLANILLVRASGRARELSVRSALGATRWRIASLLIAESTVIAATGGLLGVGLAVAANWALERVQLDVGIPLGITLGLDARVLVLAVGVTVLTVIAFGVGPALNASRARALGALRAGAATPDRRSSRVRAVLVGSQVAIATVLLAGSTLMLRSLQRSQTLDPGFAAANVELFAASPEQLGYDEIRGRALWTEIMERAERVHGVRSVALALMVPLGNRGDLIAIGPVGEKRPPEQFPYNYVSAGYFSTLRIPLVAGRDFLANDDRRAADVAIVNAAMAGRFFGRENAVGRILRVLDRSGRERQVTVVGVTGNVKVRTLSEPARPMVYLSFGQWHRPDMVLHVRTDARAPNVVRDVVAAIRAVEPNLAVDAQTMAQATAFSLIPLRLAAGVLGFAGAVGLLLAALGVFGLVAYAVSLRTREIGLRMALGAQRPMVVRFVMSQGLRPVLAGLLVGFPAAIGAGSLLRGILVGVGPADPISLLLVSAALLASAAAAVFVPVRRAVRVDPARVLREE